MTEEIFEERCQMSDNSSYQIHAFMRNQLNLKGNELLVYAVIYSFTAKSGQGYYYGSRDYISACTGAELRTVDRTIKSLVEKGLISKKIVRTRLGKFSIYKAEFDVIKNQEKSISTLDKTPDSYCQNVAKLETVLETKCPKLETITTKNTTNYANLPVEIAPNKDSIYINNNKIEIVKEGLRPNAPLPPTNGSFLTPTENTPNVSRLENINSNNGRGFQPPTLQEVRTYFLQNRLKGNPDEFYHHYESVNWFKGNTKITNWQSASKVWSFKQIQFDYQSKKDKDDYEDDYDKNIQQIGEFIF